MCLYFGFHHIASTLPFQYIFMRDFIYHHNSQCQHGNVSESYTTRCAGSLSCPFNDHDPVHFQQQLDQLNIVGDPSGCQAVHSSGASGNAAQTAVPVCVVCRRGNDSQLAVQLLKQKGWANVFDLEGGLTAWARDTGTFPQI